MKVYEIKKGVEAESRGQVMIGIDATPEQMKKICEHMDQEYFDKLVAKKAAMLADMEATKAGRNAFICGKIAELLNEVKAAERELAIAEENKQTLSHTPPLR